MDGAGWAVRMDRSPLPLKVVQGAPHGRGDLAIIGPKAPIAQRWNYDTSPGCQHLRYVNPSVSATYSACPRPLSWPGVAGVLRPAVCVTYAGADPGVPKPHNWRYGVG